MSLFTDPYKMYEQYLVDIGQVLVLFCKAWSDRSQRGGGLEWAVQGSVL